MDDDTESIESAKEKLIDSSKEGSKGKSPKEKKEPEWKKFATMSVEEKRELYRCGEDFKTLQDIETWVQYFDGQSYFFHTQVPKPGKRAFPFNKDLNEKVSLWTGDITTLEIDAIVNAANESLLGGGGVDGCIHRAAGRTLVEECRLLHGCETGNTKLTLGHKLPAKYVLHTVGPIGKQEHKLESCYKTCLKLCLEHNIRTVAFCCISTGIYGYPNKDAAEVALKTTREWLETNADAVDRIIFCLFLQKDIDIYHSLMLKYFPPRKEEDIKESERKKANEKKKEEIEEESEMKFEEEPQQPSKKHKQDEDSKHLGKEKIEDVDQDLKVKSVKEQATTQEEDAAHDEKVSKKITDEEKAKKPHPMSSETELKEPAKEEANDDAAVGEQAKETVLTSTENEPKVHTKEEGKEDSIDEEQAKSQQAKEPVLTSTENEPKALTKEGKKGDSIAKEQAKSQQAKEPVPTSTENEPKVLTKEEGKEDSIDKEQAKSQQANEPVQMSTKSELEEEEASPMEVTTAEEITTQVESSEKKEKEEEPELMDTGIPETIV